MGEEAQEEDEGAEEKREGAGDTEDRDVSSSGESSTSAAASGRGVFSTITHAVQNTVSGHKHTLRNTSSSYNIMLQKKPSKKQHAWFKIFLLVL